jgi:hypothetical protein
LKSGAQRAYNSFMSTPLAKAASFITIALLITVLASAVSAQAQTHRRHERAPSSDADRPAPAVPADKRDSVVAAPGAYMGRPYWLGLAQCGGIYFKLNVLYTSIAVHARVTKPNPVLNSEVTRKLNDAIKAATVYFTAAERFLMNDRGIERTDAVLVYDGQARAAGDRFKGTGDDASVSAAISAALAAARTCPALYQACREAYPKACSEQLAPIS